MGHLFYNYIVEHFTNDVLCETFFFCYKIIIPCFFNDSIAFS